MKWPDDGLIIEGKPTNFWSVENQTKGKTEMEYFKVSEAKLCDCSGLKGGYEGMEQEDATVTGEELGDKLNLDQVEFTIANPSTLYLSIC